MERREPYNAVLEAAMGYTGACSVAAMDDLALANEKVDTLDEGLGEQTMRVDRVNQDLTEWATDFTDERVRARESNRFLRREVMSLKVLCDSLVCWGVEGRLGEADIVECCLVEEGANGGACGLGC